ncbi:MAG: Phenylalanyl-tRNA synthetase beta subunit [Candidatus Methanohalarchaeum thermophilum]|uniref:Phenylalanine--tRNA ligase beta subunit n=1 Tax=Methanohalarchaeum thermophilum TaxID=1903181 RepID=A0A1Q6DTG7_METT1|nr:MAG: Phenylalanyl-tRNA synthetase beta subunit [Candidatus Methanohalarchaeum thermophilum]
MAEGGTNLPIVKLDKTRLEQEVGEDIDLILEKIPMIGADIERINPKEVDIEFFPNRPDLFNDIGVSRALKGFLDIEKGAPVYNTETSNHGLEVTKDVQPVRPEIVGAVVKDLKLSEKDIESLVELQEHLHWGLGRDRKKVSIGLHDLKDINFPFKYTAVEPSSTEFTPLGFNEEMDLSEILKKHEKGKKYGKILKEKSRYPILKDKDDKILSFPPIINGVTTEVDEKTSNIFIDVTGTDRDSIEDALNILVTSLSDIGGKIYDLQIHGVYNRKTPELDHKTYNVDIKDIKELLGFKATKDEIKDSLKKMRFGAEINGENVKVNVPPYRADILHPHDIIEDVAIGYGYQNLKPRKPNIPGVGSSHDIEETGKQLREIMTGLGYLEVMTLTLTNEKNEYINLNREIKESVEIENPITEEHTILRNTLLPSLLEILKLNQHRELPQRIFEYGEVIHPTKEFAKDCYHLSGISIHSNANFSEMKSVINAIFREINIDYELSKSDDKSFIKGRRAEIKHKNKKIGIFGEIHPKVLQNHDLVHPAAGFEIEANKLTNEINN